MGGAELSLCAVRLQQYSCVEHGTAAKATSLQDEDKIDTYEHFPFSRGSWVVTIKRCHWVSYCNCNRKYAHVCILFDTGVQ